MKGEYKPLDGDDLPPAYVSDREAENDHPAALRFLARHGALDLAPMLGIEGAA